MCLKIEVALSLFLTFKRVNQQIGDKEHYWLVDINEFLKTIIYYFFSPLCVKVNGQSSNKTALQVAAHQGHVDVVKILVQAGANLSIPDQEGDTALHYAVFG